MPLYSYKAADSSGKIVQSVMEAETEAELVVFLQQKGFLPIRISPASKKISRAEGVLSFDLKTLFQRVSSKDVMYFTQDLTALLKAGLPVDRSLKILVQASENPAFQEIVKQILNTIEGGIDLSEALSRHPRVFSEFYVNMVKAGEAGGILEHVLERMGIFLETSQELKDFITSAMVYPLFLIFVGGASIIVLMTFVIPKFSVMFADMGDAIPLSTRILLDASTLFRDFWWAGLIGCLLLFFSGRRYLQTPNGRIRFDRLKMKVPMVGDVVRKVEVSRITRTLGTLIDSGVPILRALVLVKDIISNKVIASRMDEIHDRVKEGERLSVPLEQTTIFPPLALHMIRVGEETGNLSGMLLKVADNYEKTVKNGVKRVVGLLEPVMILMMGCIVGFIVISMLMAIFSMNEMPM